MATMGDRIKSARKAKGMTQSELATRIGVKYSAIHKYEAGLIVNLKRDIIARLAEALEVKPSYLLGLDDEVRLLLKEEVESRESGQAGAKENMYKTFGQEHIAADLRAIGDKTVLLYYKPLPRDTAPELLNLIRSVEDFSYTDMEHIVLMVQGYLRANPQIREIVDTALKPYQKDIVPSREIG